MIRVKLVRDTVEQITPLESVPRVGESVWLKGQFVKVIKVESSTPHDPSFVGEVTTIVHLAPPEYAKPKSLGAILRDFLERKLNE